LLFTELKTQNNGIISLSWLANIYVLPVAIGTDPGSNINYKSWNSRRGHVRSGISDRIPR